MRFTIDKAVNQTIMVKIIALIIPFMTGLAFGQISGASASALTAGMRMEIAF
jgi:hypothetical protein